MKIYISLCYTFPVERGAKTKFRAYNSEDLGRIEGQLKEHGQLNSGWSDWSWVRPVRSWTKLVCVSLVDRFLSDSFHVSYSIKWSIDIPTATLMCSEQWGNPVKPLVQANASNWPMHGGHVSPFTYRHINALRNLSFLVKISWKCVLNCIYICVMHLWKCDSLWSQ